MAYDVPTSTQETNFEIVHIPEGLDYVVEFTEVKDAQKEGIYGKKSVFIFNVIEHNKQLAVTAYKRTAKSANRMGQILTALGLPLDNTTIDLTKFYGTKCKARIEDYDKKVKVKNAQGVEEEKVVKASAITKLKPLAEKK